MRGKGSALLRVGRLHRFMDGRIVVKGKAKYFTASPKYDKALCSGIL